MRRFERSIKSCHNIQVQLPDSAAFSCLFINERNKYIARESVRHTKGYILLNYLCHIDLSYRDCHMRRAPLSLKKCRSS